MSNPLISVITPFSRGIKELTTLIRDFNNQTFPKNSMEWVIVSDGQPSKEISEFMNKNCPPYAKFVWIKKDIGNMKIAPGTRPRNHGISVSRGNFVCFIDDDDRVKDVWIEKLCEGIRENMIVVCQMSCGENRMFKGGDPTRIRLIPEAGLPYFPIICHVGTPCFCLPRPWAVDNPWRDEPEHDFRFIKRIVEKYHPQIKFVGGMLVDVDGAVTRNLRDWVSRPPFYRD